MRTRKFKTQRGWLDFVARRGIKGEREIYVSLDDFFRNNPQYCYCARSKNPFRTVRNETVDVPSEWKIPFARAVVDFHFRRRSARERERISAALANGCGDLSFFQSFVIQLQRNGGAWEYVFSTCGLSGLNYDWCRRKYLQSI